MFDKDGYPTEEALKKVADWPMDGFTKPYEGFHALMDYIRELWCFPEYFHREGDVYRFSTVGWSGNEDVIGAMRQNQMFWLMFWQQSRRGGHYIFCPMGFDKVTDCDCGTQKTQGKEGTE